MFTTKTLEFPLSKLPKSSREAHRSPGLINNLLLVSILCDAGCGVWFHNKCYKIGFNGEIIIRGWRDMESNMWQFSLRDEGGSNVVPSDDCNTTGGAMPFQKFLANNIYECENTTQLIEFYHATLGYPDVSTWCKVIKDGYFQGWPSLTSTHVRRFIKICNET